MKLVVADGGDRERALRLAGELEAEIVGAGTVDPSELVLALDAQGLALVRDGMEVRGDFSKMLPRAKQGALQRELLVKAARLKGVEQPTAFDATAGLGEDSFLLASAGFKVTLCEFDPVIAALLRDAVDRARADERTAAAAARMTVVRGDSKEILDGLSQAPDVVYLDPMFPTRTKSAAVKKKFQLIHDLEAPCTDEHELVQAALVAHPRKVVIKRPIKGAFLDGIKPSHSVSGKAVRYDCIVLPR